MYEFFVSYSRYDADVARSIGEAFTRLGVPAWVAEREILIEGRRNLQDEGVLRDILSDAAARSRRCLVLLSGHAFDDSAWVMPVELPMFLNRVESPVTSVVWPVLIDSSADVKRRWDREIDSRGWPRGAIAPVSAECPDPAESEKTVRDVCRDGGVAIADDVAALPPRSARTATARFTVRTEHRQFTIALDIGTEWAPQPPATRGMLLNAKNADTGMVVNLIVGAMPMDFQREKGTAHVESANYFAEPFVTRRMSVLSEAARTGRGLWSLLKMKAMVAAAGAQEVLGSHVVNVLGQPHFAYTYRMTPPVGPPLIARKYSIILAPPESADGRLFEFVFTAGLPGEYRDFLRRVPRVDTLVRSLRFLRE